MANQKTIDEEIKSKLAAAGYTDGDTRWIEAESADGKYAGFGGTGVRALQNEVKKKNIVNVNELVGVIYLTKKGVKDANGKKIANVIGKVSLDGLMVKPELPKKELADKAEAPAPVPEA